jgi:hypothetical protein
VRSAGLAFPDAWRNETLIQEGCEEGWFRCHWRFFPDGGDFLPDKGRLRSVRADGANPSRGDASVCGRDGNLGRLGLGGCIDQCRSNPLFGRQTGQHDMGITVGWYRTNKNVVDTSGLVARDQLRVGDKGALPILLPEAEGPGRKRWVFRGIGHLLLRTRLSRLRLAGLRLRLRLLLRLWLRLWRRLLALAVLRLRLCLWL